MSTAPPPDQTTNVMPHDHPRGEPCCPSCGSKGSDAVSSTERYVFAIGKLDVRFPNLGLEREFQRAAQRIGAAASPRGERIASVLREHRHIALRVCPLLLVGGVPAYVVAPSAAYVRDSLIDALIETDKADQWAVVSGRLGPLCRPTDCGGVVAPVLACEELYSFSVGEWSRDLAAALQPAVQAKRVTEKAVVRAAAEVFGTVVSSAENAGASDPHRALNYALVRHPGVFLAVAERSGRAVLDKIETRALPSLAGRRQVAIVLSFIDSTTGVPERLFCRVDVTDQWPFIAGSPEGGAGPLGLMPFVENEIVGALF